MPLYRGAKGKFVAGELKLRCAGEKIQKAPDHLVLMPVYALDVTAGELLEKAAKSLHANEQTRVVENTISHSIGDHLFELGQSPLTFGAAEGTVDGDVFVFEAAWVDLIGRPVVDDFLYEIDRRQRGATWRGLSAAPQYPSTSSKSHNLLLTLKEPKAVLHVTGEGKGVSQPFFRLWRKPVAPKPQPRSRLPSSYPAGVGRKTRSFPPAIRRAMQRRDAGCRFPGCSATRFVDAHHVRHWADGGETKLHNLVLLCRRHHRLIHEDGFGLGARVGGGFTFSLPNGETIPATTDGRSRGNVEAIRLANRVNGLAITPHTAVPLWNGERMDAELGILALVQRE